MSFSITLIKSILFILYIAFAKAFNVGNFCWVFHAQNILYAISSKPSCFQSSYMASSSLSLTDKIRPNFRQSFPSLRSNCNRSSELPRISLSKKKVLSIGYIHMQNTKNTLHNKTYIKQLILTDLLFEDLLTKYSLESKWNIWLFFYILHFSTLHTKWMLFFLHGLTDQNIISVSDFKFCLKLKQRKCWKKKSVKTIKFQHFF